MNITDLPKLQSLKVPKIFSVENIKEFYKDINIKDIQFQQKIINDIGGIDFHDSSIKFDYEKYLWAKVKNIDWNEIYKYGIDFNYLTKNPSEDGYYVHPLFWINNWIPYQAIEQTLEINNGMKNLSEYIIERLGPSLNGNDLLNQIIRHFGKEYFYDCRVIKNYHIDFKCDYDLREDDWFKSILNFYNYKCSLKYNKFHLQARKAENADEMVYKTGYCLHITNKSSAEKIEKNGLIPKKKKDVHGNRVYLFSGDIKNETDIKICIDFIRLKYSSKNKEINPFINNDVVVFSIDLNKLKNEEKPVFYYDPSFSGSKAVYCERMIPNKCITNKIEIKESDVYHKINISEL